MPYFIHMSQNVRKPIQITVNWSFSFAGDLGLLCEPFTPRSNMGFHRPHCWITTPGVPLEARVVP